jgi:hypothetical protein
MEQTTLVQGKNKLDICKTQTNMISQMLSLQIYWIPQNVWLLKLTTEKCAWEKV